MEPFVIAKKTFANIRDISIRSGRFIRKYKNPLCLSILCVGTLWGIFQILLPGHVFNGDFALYIRQALSISAGDMKQIGEDMQAMINGSTYNRYSPTLYPWGFPLLLSLITSFSDIDYWLFKTEGIILFIGALFLLYRNLTHQKGGMNNKVFFILSLTGGNVFYWHFCNSVTSEIFFLFFLQLSFFCMYSLYNTQRKTFSTIHLFILGIILYFTAQIRTEGYFVFLSLAALQWKYRIKKKALWMPYVGAIVSGVFFSLIFPNGYLEHIEHFKMLSWEQVVDNLFHFYNYPIRIFHFPLPWFNTFFWVCWTIGLYIGIHKYTAETVYMLSCILLLMIWPYPEIRYWFALFPLCFLCFAEGIHLFFEQQARIVLEPIKGYGNALKKGIENCYGKYIIMGDADDSYNFLELHDFIKRLEEGYDMVIGNRFAGGIHHQAMPWLHRYIGNPILSSIARILFKNNIKDYHCGLRAFKTDCYHELNPQCQGMEFASELIVLAIIHHRLISEVPVTLYPDGRNRKSHLVTWRDGYRHLRLLLQLYIHPR